MKRKNFRDQFAPDGVLLGGFECNHDLGCIQTYADTHEGKKADELDTATFTASRTYFQMLHNATGGNPCNGCRSYKGGTCPAFKANHSSQRLSADRIKNQVESKKGTEKFPNLTIAQIAGELRISKSEVRRRKLRGEI